MKKVCIVGYGAIGPIHARAVSRLDHTQLYAVCDPNAQRAAKAVQKYGIKSFSDFDEMLQSGEVDAIHICTPHYLHKDMAVKALALGLDVVLEKPATMNASELDELLAAEKASKGRLCVMLQNRTKLCVRTLREIMRNEEQTGALIGVNGYMTWYRSEEYYQSDAWRGKWATEGGGLLINQAIHLIDLMTYIGGEIEAVRGSISTKLLDGAIEVEDTADALFRFKNGVRGCFYAANTSVASTPVQMDVFFEKVRYRYADDTLYEFKNEKFVRVVCTDDDNAPGKKVWGDGHSRVIQSFYSKEKNNDSYATLADAENSARALFAFYESAKNGSKWLSF